MHVANHLAPDVLKTLAANEPAKRRFLRIRAVILASEGQTAEAIAEALGCSRRTVQNWIAAYNKEGSDSFHDQPRPGRPKLFPDQKLDQLRARLDAGALPGDGVCTLRAKDIQTILQNEFGVLYTLPGLYDFLHRIGYSYLDPRPKHVKSDPEAQEEFKKKFPVWSMRSPALIPAKRSRSGSRTKPGSDKKGR
jgi:transposase